LSALLPLITRAVCECYRELMLKATAENAHHIISGTR
jgi:hypothetical protein